MSNEKICIMRSMSNFSESKDIIVSGFLIMEYITDIMNKHGIYLLFVKCPPSCHRGGHLTTCFFVVR